MQPKVEGFLCINTDSDTDTEMSSLLSLKQTEAT